MRILKWGCVVTSLLVSAAFSQGSHKVPRAQRTTKTSSDTTLATTQTGRLSFRGLSPGMDYDQFLEVYRARLKSQHEEGLVRYAEPDMNCHEPAIGLKICSISGDG